MNVDGLRTFSALLWKEIKEAKVKFLTALVAFLLLGLFGVLLLYWLPDLLPPEILIPIHFTAAEAFQNTIGDLVQTGTLIAALISMDVIAGERHRKTLDLLLVRPVSRVSIITAKFISRAGIVFVAVIAAAIPTWYYTTYLFGELSFFLAIQATAFIALELVFASALTMTFSIVAKTEYVAAISGIVVSVFFASISILAEPWSKITPYHYVDTLKVLNGTMEAATYWQNLTTILGFIAAIFILCVLLFSSASIQKAMRSLVHEKKRKEPHRTSLTKSKNR